MRKSIFLFFIFPLSLFAQSFLISNIPLPKTYVQNLEPYECSDKCMQEFIDHGMIFSFLSYAQSKLENKELDEIRMMHIPIFNLSSSIVGDKLRIALLLPYKKIGRYASTTTNAAFAYLMAKNNAFELKSYKIESESIEDIDATLSKIEEDGFDYIIAPLTQDGFDAVAALDPKTYIYFPTIHKKDTSITSPYLFYGGIDYRAQSDLLLKEAVSPLVIFYDKSPIGKKLSLYEEEKFKTEDNVSESTTDEESETNETYVYDEESDKEILEPEKTVVKFSIPRRTTNLERQLKENEDIKKGSFFINTPIVKSGMIMSQLTLYDVNATNILSTQINYDPLLLSMTQYIDRKHMILANSITEHDNVLIETNSLLGNDIVYDWINYTTTVGVDYFFHMATNEDREYNIEMMDNQMLYPIELLKPSLSRFKKYYSTAK